MVLDQAEDALVVVAGALGAECDNNALWGVGFDNSLSHGEGVHIALICEELEGSGQVAIVDHIQKAVRSLLCLHLTEVDWPRAQLHIVSIRYTTATELNLVASESGNFE